MIRNTEERLNELDRLFEKGIYRNLDEIIEMIEVETEDIVKEKIINYLKTQNNSRVVEKVITFFESEDIYLRNAAVEIISAFYEFPLDNLSKMLSHKNKHVRKLALDTLYNTHNPMAATFLADGLKDEDINNVISAVEYLGKLQAYKYADEITDLLKKAENPFLVITILETLSLIGNKYSYMVIKEKYKDITKINGLLLIPLLKIYCKFPEANQIKEILKLEKKFKMVYKEVLDYIKIVLEKLSEEELDDDLEYLYKMLVKLLAIDIPAPNKYEALDLISIFEIDEVEEIFIKFLDSKENILKVAAAEQLLEINPERYRSEIEKRIKSINDEEIKETLLDLIS